MKQDIPSIATLNEEVSVIDKITVPANAIPVFFEKSGFIRNFLRQQPGFVKDEAFEQKDENDNLIIITIATWTGQQYLNNAKITMQVEMKKERLNMPKFLKQHDIVMERGIYTLLITPNQTK